MVLGFRGLDLECSDLWFSDLRCSNLGCSDLWFSDLGGQIQGSQIQGARFRVLSSEAFLIKPFPDTSTLNDIFIHISHECMIFPHVLSTCHVGRGSTIFPSVIFVCLLILVQWDGALTSMHKQSDAVALQSFSLSSCLRSSSVRFAQTHQPLNTNPVPSRPASMLMTRGHSSDLLEMCFFLY